MPSIFRQDCGEGGLLKFPLRQKGGTQVFLDERFSRRTSAAHRQTTFWPKMPCISGLPTNTDNGSGFF
jgi:hypothetical protein